MGYGLGSGRFQTGRSVCKDIRSHGPQGGGEPEGFPRVGPFTPDFCPRPSGQRYIFCNAVETTARCFCRI
jgi:hypothetical protein